MLRIALLSLHTSPAARLGSWKAGGMNVYIRTLSRELGRRGIAVDIFTRRQDDLAPDVLEMDENVRLVHLSAGPAEVLPASQLPSVLAPFEERLLAWAEDAGLRYDVIHSHYWASAWVGDRVKRVWDAPHTVMFHTLGAMKNQARLSEHESEFRLRAEEEAVAGAERIIVASPHERAALIRLYRADPSRISVIPLGVDLELFRPIDKTEARSRVGLPAGKPAILFVGRPEPLKGIDILIGAAARLHGEASDFSVMVVGGDANGGGEVEHLRDLARTLGVEHHVTFVGSVEQSLLPYYYSASDVCVVPSFYESFGLVALEAMACGTPVVASRVGGLTYTVRDGETGYLVPWRCPEPFAERLEMLLANEPLRRALGVAARKQAMRFPWSQAVDQVISVYSGLLGMADLAGDAVAAV